jgi:hypothetical protein
MLDICSVMFDAGLMVDSNGNDAEAQISEMKWRPGSERTDSCVQHQKFAKIWLELANQQVL